MVKTGLQIGIRTTQKLSPQQIQLMKLLQIPSANLEQRVQEELEINPALEQGDEMEQNEDGMSEMELEASRFGDEKKEKDPDAQTSSDSDKLGDDSADYENEDGDFEMYETVSLDETPAFEMDDYLMNYIEDDPASYRLSGDHYNSDEEDRSSHGPVESTYHEHLETQLGLMKFEDDEELAIAMQVIGSIDDDGYLTRTPSEMVNDMVFGQNMIVAERDVARVLKKVQQLEPAGTGCRDLQECLLIQLRRRLEMDEGTMTHKERSVLHLAIRLVYEYFEEFTKKHYAKLQRYLEITEDELREAQKEVLKCNPKPASGFATTGDRALNYVVPDFIVSNRDGELELNLNSRNAPDLRVSDHYCNMLMDFHKRKEVDKGEGRKTTAVQKDAVTFIKDKIASARWFIDAIRQRQQTMLRTMESILAYQKEYFLTGDQKKIRPMILKDISDMTGLDISTISRVANSKFVQTEFGTKLLKDFFSESIQTEDGEEVSTLEVKSILTEIIRDENKRKPLSDEKLRSLLKNKGYTIARRTVAKYREQLNIPVARLRKEL